MLNWNDLRFNNKPESVVAMASVIASLIAKISPQVYGNKFVEHCPDCNSILFYFRHVNHAVTMYKQLFIIAERTERKLHNILKSIKFKVK
jgi:hypothetical protein